MPKIPDGVTITPSGAYTMKDGRGLLWHIRRNPTLGKDRMWRARPAPTGALGHEPIDGPSLAVVAEKLRSRIHTPPIEPF